MQSYTNCVGRALAFRLFFSNSGFGKPPLFYIASGCVGPSLQSTNKCLHVCVQNVAGVCPIICIFTPRLYIKFFHKVHNSNCSLAFTWVCFFFLNDLNFYMCG